ncbi:DUF805 domain-containing protein [Persicobacter diffluens]|uniref:Aminopeptidase n=1 Tax=Persicobacter diffluens TaxID=981 RepID=A0AAN5ALT3_9BACT|nr:aminopeptidase [Persicobacter diffluens]
MEWYLKVLKQYFDFSGRARRKEFWMFALINSAVLILLGAFSAASEVLGGALYALYALGVFIPNLAVTVRRLHDVNKSGWWYFVIIVPLVGVFWLIYLLASEGDTGPNQYGADPKNPEDLVKEFIEAS